MNLVKWFRKNNKKLMAVVVIVLMFAFIGGSALRHFMQSWTSHRNKIVAYFEDNQKITNYDLYLARSELELLALLQANSLLRSISEPISGTLDLQALFLGEVLFADRPTSPVLINRVRQIISQKGYSISLKQINDIYKRSTTNDVYWLLLKKETELAGIRVTKEEAGKQLENIIPRIIPNTSYSRFVQSIINRQRIPEEQILATFAKLLSVLDYAGMVCSSQNVTAQQIRHNISTDQQTLNVEFVRFNSSLFADDQNEPAEQKISEHLEKYKSFYPVTISKENPYGFGYKLADRVRLEYIAVKLDDIEKIIQKPTQEEEEEYYLKNKENFTEQVPSDPNDPNSPLTTQTQKYAEVANNISNQLLQQKKNSKAVQILQDVKTLTEVDFEEMDMEPSQITDEQFKKMAGDYNSAAKKLSQKYGINLYVGQTGWLTATDMQQDQYLRSLYIPGYGGSLTILTRLVFAMDALGSCELGPFADEKPMLYQNIGPARDFMRRIMLITRVTDAKKASEPENINQTFSKSTLDLEPPDQNDTNDNPQNRQIYSVREKVVEDLKKLAAMDTTKKKANEFKNLVAELGWEDAVDKFNQLYGRVEPNEPNSNTAQTPETQDKSEQTFKLQKLTNLRRFSHQRLSVLQTQQASEPTIQDSMNLAKKEGTLLDRLYSLIPKDSNSLESVPLIVDFKPDFTYYCLKSLSINSLTRSEYEQIKPLQAYREQIAQSQSLAVVHFNPENILKRMNFRFAKKSQKADANTPPETTKGN